jgi:tetratricopeptide (TPR) repeat protein
VVVTPPPVVVVAPARPRLAVFGFLLGCEPGLVPPAIGEWAADQLASYFGAGYEVIDRGEVCWYMGRLGITMREVLNDPAARRCLAQALNARFFVFGAIEQTHSFNVTTHLMDAETGARTGTGMIHVQDHAELKLRMHELARQTGAPPAEQAKLAKAGPETEKALNEARRLQKAGDHARAAEVARAALKADPGNVALQALQQEAEAKARQAKLEEERRRGAAERALTQEAARRKQQELAKQAAEARARAERDARARTEEARRQQGLAKQKAAEQLRAQARAAAARGNQAQAVAALQSAAALKPGDREVQRELAQARAARDQAQKEQALEEQQRRQAEQQRQREEALARVAREKAQREQAEVERRKAQEARDRSAYDGLVRQAKDLLGKKQSDAALAAAQSAQRLRPGAEAAALVRQAQQGAALAAAERKGAQARAEAERRQAEERKQREQAAAAARRRADEAAARAAKVRAFLAEGQKQMAARQLDRAVNAYREALNLDPHSGEARSSLQRAEKALADSRKPSPPPVPPVDPVARKRKADYDLAMSAARSAVQKGNYQGAVNSFNEALRLMPGDPQATAGRAQAGHLLQAVNAAEARKRDEARKADEARRQAEEARRASEFSRLLSQGQAAQRARRYGEAVQAYEQALKVRPGDPTATRGLQEARQALTAPRVPPKPPTPPPAPRAPTPAPKSPPPPPAAEYERQMQAGAALDKQGKHAEAVAAYQAALRARPGDARAAGAVRNAQLLQHLTSARAAHAARRFPDAVREYEEALKLQPANAEVKAALQRARAGKP